MEKRKGSRTIKDIPSDILHQLNAGTIESANLVEWLAIDQKILLENVLETLGRKKYCPPIFELINGLKKQTITSVNEAMGTGLLRNIMVHKDQHLLDTMLNHPADAVRCWSTYIIAKNQTKSFEQILHDIKPLAADLHFGVREIAWMAVRPLISKNLTESIQIFTSWVTDNDENVRRFASEATRPRGVWCEHIESLKKHPALALPILDPLKEDPSKYVQDSVGNWLNDASKTQPDFVRALCEKWKTESEKKETAYIVKKALRTISK